VVNQKGGCLALRVNGQLTSAGCGSSSSQPDTLDASLPDGSHVLGGVVPADVQRVVLSIPGSPQLSVSVHHPRFGVRPACWISHLPAADEATAERWLDRHGKTIGP
jgi:hypothetical protein